jgi:hypothetical protein
MVAIAAIMVTILAAIFNMVAKTHNKFRSIFIENGALRNFTHFGSHLKNYRHFEMALVTITFL